MKNEFEFIYKKARKELSYDQMSRWIHFAYGIMERDINSVTAKLLLKGIEQDKKI